MGLRIDSSRSDLAALTAASRRPGGIDARQRRVDTLRQLGGVSEPAPPQVGFGDNTISLAGVSLDTLGRNLASSRATVPSPEELREETLERIRTERDRIEDQEANRPRFEAPPPQPVRGESREGLGRTEGPRGISRIRVEPAPAARNFEPAPPEGVFPARPEPPGSGFDVSV